MTATRLSCRTFAANAVGLRLHALAYNLGNFMRTLGDAEDGAAVVTTSLCEKLIKIPRAAAAQALRRPRLDHPLARQMLGERILLLGPHW
jgi:hypothetical protein